MYVHREARLLFLAHPRTASNATHRALTQQAGFEPSPDHHGRIGSDQWPSLGVELDDSWCVFSTVRNPFDALVSWRFMRQIPGDRWGAEWWDLLMRYLEPWVEPGRMWFHADDCSRILRYESLDADLNDVLVGRGLGPVELEQWNITRRRPAGPYQDHFDDALRARVEEVFGAEMARFGYTFDSLDRPAASE